MSHANGPTEPSPRPAEPAGTAGLDGRPAARSVLAANLREILHLLLSGVPAWVARGRLYLALRRRLSATPERFEPPPPRAEHRRGQWLNRKIVFPGVDLVVDGFPGSATSWVSNSLRDALGESVWITSHFHHTVQLERAIALGVPAVVVVREPAAAAGSLKSKQPELWEWLIIWRWIVYHRYVLRRRDRLDVVLFETVTRDLDHLRRRSPAVARLLRGAPLTGQDRYRRASERRLAIDETRPVNRFLLRVARRLYRRLAATP